MLPAFITTILYSISIISATRSAKMLGGTEANFWRITVAAFSLALWAYTFAMGMGGVSFPLFFISGVIGVGASDPSTGAAHSEQRQVEGCVVLDRSERTFGSDLRDVLL